MNPNQQPANGPRIPKSTAILSNSEWKTKFQEGDEVWVQNQSDNFISMDIEVGQGNPPQHVKIPRMREPYRITDDVTLDLLKRSNQFGKHLAKRSHGRQQLIVLTAAEADAWFAISAKQKNLFTPSGEPDVIAAYELSRRRYRELTTVPTSEQTNGGFDASGQFAPPKSVMELVQNDLNNRGYDGASPGARREYDAANLGRAPVMMHERIDARVLHLCNQVANDVPPHMLLDSEVLFEELKSMEGRLNEDSLQHIVAHGRYKTVKAWANAQLAMLSSATEIDDTRGRPTLGQAAPAAPQRAEVYGMPGQTAGYYQPGVTPQQATYPNMITPPGAGVDAATYQGPSGFANAGLAGAGITRSTEITGPDGQPIR